MSQNPWKKQADANKAQPPKPTGTGAPPPWMKKNDQTLTQPAPQTNQPGQSSTSEQPAVTSIPVQQPPVPAFKPPAQNAPMGGSPWAKPGGNPPMPPSKPPGSTPATSGNVPAWMKNKPGASPAQTDRKAEEEKAEEERMRKQKQQQQERKRKQEEQRVQREKQEQQRAKQEEAKKKKGSKKSSPVKSAKQARDIPTFTTLFHKYLNSINLALAKQENYFDKIQNQKLLVQCLAKFTESCSEGLRKYLQERRITQRKKNVINLKNIYVEYAMVEGVSGDPSCAYFRTKSIENLQEKHRHYQVLFHLIVKLIRKSSSFRLRVPLLSRVSWRGIEFLCEGVCDDLLDSVPVPAQNFLETHAEFAQLEKELRQTGYEYLNKKTLQLKKISLEKDELFVVYLPDNFDALIPKQARLNQLIFAPYVTPNCETVSNLSLLASHRLNLSYACMRQFGNLKRNSTQILNQAYLNLFQVAHAIRIVYASSQGELQEMSFWALVFDGNPDIWTLVKKAYQGLYGEVKGGSEVQLRNRFALAKIIEQFAPVQFGIGKKQSSLQRIPVYVQSVPILHCYPLQSLELYEISELFNKTLDNPSKLKISYDSLGYQQILLTLANELYARKVLAFNNKLTIMLQKGQTHQDKETIRTAISQAEMYEIQIGKGREMERIIILPTLLSLYMAAQKMGIEVVSNEQSKSQSRAESKDMSDRFNNSKMEESIVSQVKNSAQMGDLQQLKPQQQANETGQNEKYDNIEKKSSKQSPKKRRVNYTDYEEALLKVFGELLKYIQLLFEDEKQVWVHAGLYMIIASYYSRPISNQPKQKLHIAKQFEEAEKSTKKQGGYFSNQKSYKFSSSPSLTKSQNPQREIQQGQGIDGQAIHPFKKQCMKFVELGHDIQMRFYGAQSPQMAQFLFNQSQIYYNIKEYKKAEISINEALKIFKSSSKHAKFALNGTIIYGKAMFQQGKLQKDSKLVGRSVQILQNTVQQLVSLSMEKEIIEVYEFLCANMDYIKNGTGATKIKWEGDGFYQIKIEQYLEKMSEISFSTQNYEFLKKVIKKIIRNQANLYSKEIALSLKDMHAKYIKQNDLGEQTENDKLKRQSESITFLEEQKVNFGGLVDLIKWSFGIIKVKSQSSQFEKATEVMEAVLGLYPEKQVLQMLSL